MIKNISEILEEISNTPNRHERKAILKNNASPHFLKVLQYTFDAQYQFYIKEFPKEYKIPDTVIGIRIAGIESEIRKAYLFLKGDPTADSLSEEKRKVLLIQLLESFEPKEAEVFVNMMKKDLKCKGLTKSLIEEVFPGLI